MDPVSLFTTAEERTFEHQEALPSLPIPTLEHTLNRYLDSVRPHVTDEEFKVTESVARRFRDGVGKQLHEKLMARANHQRNWIETWWDDKVYLELRVPSAPLVNVSGPILLRHIWPPREGTQIERAALWIYYVMDYWEHLRKERLRPDRNAKGRVMSMNQYARAFNTCKIPGVKKDKLCCHFKTETAGDCPSHIVVLCKGRIFSFDTFHSTGNRLTFSEIEKQLIHIRAACDASPEGAGVGSLTGDNRTSWAQTRSHLVSSHPDNWSHLQTIETAVVAVCLDETSPRNDSEVQYYSLAGDSMNRWFDKSYSLIVFKNGLAAANCDHAPFEGIILVSSINYVRQALLQCGGRWTGSTAVRNLPKPTELEFRLEDPVFTAIQKARAINRALNESIEVTVDEFLDYGKKFLRGAGLHPDTHVQLALQYAYYKTYNRPAPTYETATTRQFYNGRTETTRSCTVEALTWSKAMLDPAASSQKRHRLYLVAANKHNQLMTEAQNNQGCDRHLFGLQCLAEEEGIPLPEIYTDPGYKKSGGSGNFILSTSFLGYTPVSGCVAPMCEDGYCAAYSIQNNKINTNVSSWTRDKNTDSVRFTKTLMECLREMGDLVHSKDTASRL